MHAEGAMVLASRPLAPQSVVFVRLKSFKLMGFAQVRHCTERGLWGYTIGLAFSSPLMQEELGAWQFQHVQPTDDGCGSAAPRTSPACASNAQM